MNRVGSTWSIYLFFALILLPSVLWSQTTTIANNGTQVTAASVLRGSTNNLLVKLSLTASSGTPTLNWLQFSSMGTYAASDVANLKLWYSTDAVLDGGDVVVKTIASPTGAGNLQTFNSIGQALSTTTRYFFITVDINSGATLGATMGANSIGSGNFSVSAGTTAGSTSVAGLQTFAFPTITLANNGTQPAASNVAIGTSDHILHQTSFTVASIATTLTGLQCTTTGTYTTADLSNLKVRYSADNVLDAGDATLSIYTSVPTAGTIVFPSFSSQLMPVGTSYIFITADISAATTSGRTITVGAIGTGSFTVTAGTKSGSSTTGFAQTISTPGVAISNNGTQVGAASVTQGTTSHVLNRIALTVTTASATLTGMQCTTAGTYTSLDIINLKVYYSTDATLDAGDAVLSTYTTPGTAGTKVFPSFTATVIPVGVRYIFVTADIFAGASSPRNISVSAIGTADLTFVSASESSTSTGGGAQTFGGVTYTNYYVVTSTADAGAGTLRQAIADANASSGTRDYIYFNLGAGGPFTITLTTSTTFGSSQKCGLTTTDNSGVTIDGWSNFGNAGTENSVAVASVTSSTPMNPVHKIILTTNNSMNTVFHLNSNNNIIKGLVIMNYGDSPVELKDVGIIIGGNNNKILGCYIGTNAAGTTIGGSYQASGIHIYGSNNEIGDGTAAGANLISGSMWSGGVGGSVRLSYHTPQGSAGSGCAGNIIKGNMLGLQSDGTNQLASGGDLSAIAVGYSSVNVTGTIIGGATAGHGNVISGYYTGIYLAGNSQGTSVFGNIIGPCADGMNYVSGSRQNTGIFISGPNNIIGGNTALHRNIISGNESYGIQITPVSGSSATGNYIQGNYIGPSSSLTNIRTVSGASGNGGGKGSMGVMGLSNQDYGIYISGAASGNIIGGASNSATLTGHENVIAFNTNDGVYIQGAGSTGNRISRNSIYSNNAAGKQINLNYSGTPGNSGRAIPYITTSTVATIAGNTNTSPCNSCTIEIFMNTTGGAYDAVTYVGYIATDGSGNWTKGVSLTAGDRVMATVTDGSNNTSEFSDPTNPLPVELKYFTAECTDDQQVLCEWATASEMNNDYFTIERTTDENTSWTEIGTVKGNGNTSTVRTYSFKDEEALQKPAFYRLKQTDYNGQFEYFSPVRVDCNSYKNEMTVFPNPANGSDVNLLFANGTDADVLVVLYDVNGKETYSKMVIAEDEHKNIYTLGLTGKLAPGIYLIKATSADAVLSRKLIVK